VPRGPRVEAHSGSHRGLPDRTGIALASMGIHVIDATFLFEQPRREAANLQPSRGVGKGLVPYIVQHGKAVAHRQRRVLHHARRDRPARRTPNHLNSAASPCDSPAAGAGKAYRGIAHAMAWRAERFSVNQRSTAFLRRAGLACLAVIVAACGGGGGDAVPSAGLAADSVPPALTIASSAAGTSAGAAITFTFTWTEDVGSSFTADDVSLSGGTAGAFTRLDATRYALVVTPPAGSSGAITVSVAAGRATDLAGNANAAAASLAQPYDTRLAGWTLAWSDEFSVDGLPDASKWDYDTERNVVGWFNNELQYYARSRPENARVEGGRLIITARKERLVTAPDYGGQQYTSARLVTRGKAAWTYGFIEVRAKTPCGQGTWPAIWMLGSGGRWPDDGEIDILEQTGWDKTQVLGTVHTRAYNYFNGSLGVARGAGTRVADACTAFHDYQLTWSADRIQIGVDGVVYMVFDNPRTGDTTRWPFDNPQYLILNLAIGGDLGGAVDPAFTTQQMEVDYVRVYQK
jgi:beta-glucanase (GH16 family)